MSIALSRASLRASSRRFETIKNAFIMSSNQSINQSMSTLPTRHNPHLTTQDPLLFTPGPLTTSFSVKQAMVRDMGSRDAAFLKVS